MAALRAKLVAFLIQETFFQLQMLFMVENSADLHVPGKKMTPGSFFCLNETNYSTFGTSKFGITEDSYSKPYQPLFRPVIMLKACCLPRPEISWGLPVLFPGKFLDETRCLHCY